MNDELVGLFFNDTFAKRLSTISADLDVISASEAPNGRRFEDFLESGSRTVAISLDVEVEQRNPFVDKMLVSGNSARDKQVTDWDGTGDILYVCASRNFRLVLSRS